MPTQRSCDVCSFFRQNVDGTPAVHRYGLSRQIPAPGQYRPNRAHSVLVELQRRFGGIDLCDDCWERLAKPNTRPRRAVAHRTAE